MKNAINFLKQKIGFLLAIMLAAIVGGATTAAVMAAIPDSSGTIHACYKNNSGSARIIDSEANQVCTTSETNLNWNQHGVLGYGLIQGGYFGSSDIGIVPGTQSRNILAVHHTSDPAQPEEVLCFQVNGNPTSASLSTYQTGINSWEASFIFKNNDPDGAFSNFCEPSDNVVVTVNATGNGKFYITFFE